MKNGKGKHLTILHLYTDYKITEKPIMDMTSLQYHAILTIANEINKFKMKNKPVVVV